MRAGTRVMVIFPASFQSRRMISMEGPGRRKARVRGAFLGMLEHRDAILLRGIDDSGRLLLGRLQALHDLLGAGKQPRKCTQWRLRPTATWPRFANNMGLWPQVTMGLSQSVEGARPPL